MYSIIPYSLQCAHWGTWLQTTATVSTLIWSHAINICSHELRLNKNSQTTISFLLD